MTLDEEKLFKAIVNDNPMELNRIIDSTDVNVNCRNVCIKKIH